MRRPRGRGHDRRPGRIRAIVRSCAVDEHDGVGRRTRRRPRDPRLLRRILSSPRARERWTLWRRDRPGSRNRDLSGDARVRQAGDRSRAGCGDARRDRGRQLPRSTGGRRPRAGPPAGLACDDLGAAMSHHPCPRHRPRRDFVDRALLRRRGRRRPGRTGARSHRRPDDPVRLRALRLRHRRDLALVSRLGPDRVRHVAGRDAHRPAAGGCRGRARLGAGSRLRVQLERVRSRNGDPTVAAARRAAHGTTKSRLRQMQSQFVSTSIELQSYIPAAQPPCAPQPSQESTVASTQSKSSKAPHPQWQSPLA